MTVVLALGVVAALLLVPRAFKPGPNLSHELPLWMRIVWWINAAYCGIVHRLTIVNTPTIPLEGGALLIANHTCGVDHLILQATTRRLLGFMVAKEYYDNPICKPFTTRIGCIPVNRDGKDLSATRNAVRALHEGRIVPIFPEGRITPSSGRELGEPKNGTGFLAIRAGVPVIPAYIRGTPPTNDVWLAVVTRSNASVRFGPPIPPSAFLKSDGSGDREDVGVVTQRLMDAIRALRDQSFAEDP